MDYLNKAYDYGITIMKYILSIKMKINYDLKYFLDSIMHYGSTSFTKNNFPTIEPKDKTAFIGQRRQLSKTDIEELQAYYNC